MDTVIPQHLAEGFRRGSHRISNGFVRLALHRTPGGRRDPGRATQHTMDEIKPPIHRRVNSACPYKLLFMALLGLHVTSQSLATYGNRFPSGL